jgi:hypothetical protein
MSGANAYNFLKKYKEKFFNTLAAVTHDSNILCIILEYAAFTDVYIYSENRKSMQWLQLNINLNLEKTNLKLVPVPIYFNTRDLIFIDTIRPSTLKKDVYKIELLEMSPMDFDFSQDLEYIKL